jgi:hypothetical protein
MTHEAAAEFVMLINNPNSIQASPGTLVLETKSIERKCSIGCYDTFAPLILASVPPLTSFFRGS